MVDQFNYAFNATMGHEGGYSSDPADAGGETYRGIARRFHPDWPGWAVIDLLKIAPDFERLLARDPELPKLVRQFYRTMFWSRFWGDELARLAPRLAFEVFDTAVNMGVHRAVSFLQDALNKLNRDSRLYPDLMVDGVFGAKSLDALRIYAKVDPPELLLKVLNVLQGAHYLEYMGQDTRQEKYARGWFKRVTL